MSVRTYVRKSFEITLVAGATNSIMLLVDWLDSNGQVDEPLDGTDYQMFYSQATRVPTADTPYPEPLLYFDVVHVPGYIPEDEVEPHVGAFLLLTDSTESRKLQEEWMQHGIVDLFGVKAETGHVDLLAAGNFTTAMSATRDFT